MKKLRNKSIVILFAFILSAVLIGCGATKTPTSRLSSTQSTTLPSTSERQSTSITETKNMQRAREALNRYFTLLHDEKYSEAVDYYGGSYEMLGQWNPAVEASDHAALFKNGCEINGLQCLKVRRIVQEKQTSPSEFEFLVEFSTDDGALFYRRAIPGEAEGNTQSQFLCTVKNVGKHFLVNDLPPYVP